jgi:cytochrome c5
VLLRTQDSLLGTTKIRLHQSISITMVKKILKWVGIGLGVVLVAAGSFGLYINFSDLPSYDVQKIDLKVEATPARLERGKKLSGMLCAGCHMNPTTGAFTGQRMLDIPAEFGEVWSQNITQDPTYGIADWTDGEIAYLLRTGIHRSGRYTPPYMVKLPHMSDEDLHSIISFLRSDDPWVKAQAVQDTAPKPSFLVKMLSRFAFTPFEYPTKAIVTPAVADKLEYGKYLVNNLACFHCHSEDFKTNNDIEPHKSVGFMGGGNPMLDLNGQVIHTPNITMHPEHGIGKWTEAQFIRAVKDGFNPQNKMLRYPMERYSSLTDEEVSAIYHYIKTSVPVLNKPRIANPVVAASATTAKTEGQKIYEKYSCNSCHGDNGFANCDLRQADAKYPQDSVLIAWIKNPSKLMPGTKMPNWEGVIAEEEYKPLADYVRQLGRNHVQKASMK